MSVLRPRPLLLLLSGTLALRPGRMSSHSLRYFHTAVSRPGRGEPGYLEVGYVDDTQFVRFDRDTPSSVMEPRLQWVDQEGPETRTQTLQVRLNELRVHYSQSKAVSHTFQRMTGCDVGPDGHFLCRYLRDTYDRADYITLRVPWRDTAPHITRCKWEAAGEAERYRYYLEGTCMEWFLKYLEMGKKTLLECDFLILLPHNPQKTYDLPSHEVSLRCWALGFYPVEITLTWQQEQRYTCHPEVWALHLPFPSHELPPQPTIPIMGIIAGQVLLVVTVAVAVGAVMWRKKHSGRERSWEESDDSAQSSGVSLRTPKGETPEGLKWGGVGAERT
uniref:MHC class I-like antigen recognition-like domain-containing protein n=1 Tax=Panthera leo TaxID=9689 RepID=A0A8C9D9Q6_PANLE